MINKLPSIKRLFNRKSGEFFGGYLEIFLGNNEAVERKKRILSLNTAAAHKVFAQTDVKTSCGSEQPLHRRRNEHRINLCSAIDLAHHHIQRTDDRRDVSDEHPGTERFGDGEVAEARTLRAGS